MELLKAGDDLRQGINIKKGQDLENPGIIHCLLFTVQGRSNHSKRQTEQAQNEPTRPAQKCTHSINHQGDMLYRA